MIPQQLLQQQQQPRYSEAPEKLGLRPTISLALQQSHHKKEQLERKLSRSNQQQQYHHFYQQQLLLQQAQLLNNDHYPQQHAKVSRRARSEVRKPSSNLPRPAAIVLLHDLVYSFNDVNGNNTKGNVAAYAEPGEVSDNNNNNNKDKKSSARKSREENRKNKKKVSRSKSKAAARSQSQHPLFQQPQQPQPQFLHPAFFGVGGLQTVWPAGKTGIWLP